MQTAGLHFDQAPPFSVPLRFFLAAPLFGLAAGLWLAVVGHTALASRWAPLTIALTHLLTLGFVTQVMIGALMQLMPVVAGTPFARPRAFAWAVQTPLLAGILLYAVGIAHGARGPLRFGLALLAAALLGLALTALLRLRRAAAAYATIAAMRLALAALLVAVLLGLILGLVRSGAIPSFGHELRALADLHLAWGLAGWVGLLVIGVGYQVVPMFQLTPAYPAAVTRALAPALFAALAAWSLAHGLSNSRLSFLLIATGLAVPAALAVFALATLALQAKRRRRQPDATTRFWQLAMASLLLAAASTAALPWLENAAPRAAMLAGVLAIVGFATSVIHGMLYKIVPFLAWLHLHQRGLRYVLPNMKEILPDRRTLPHVWLHAGALGLLGVTCLAPAAAPAARAAGVLLALSYGWLAVNLLYALGVYRRALQALPSHVD
jgi:hypothetical protein